MRRFLVLFIATVLLGCQTAAPPSTAAEEEVVPERPTLQGAWKVTEASHKSPTSTWVDGSPQPSLYLFGEKHYSIMFVPTRPEAMNKAREPFSGNEPVVGSSNPTDAEKVEAYDTFIANSGTYFVSGSTFTIQPIVAKSPNFMMEGSLTYNYEIEGETLRLTLKVPWEPDAESQFTLVRLE